MRILQVIGSLAPRYGGPSTACPALCRALAEAGHEVVIYATDAGVEGREDAPLDRPVRKDGYEIRYFSAWRHPREFKISTDLLAGLRQGVSSFEAVHIYSYYGYWVWAAARACRERGVPYLLHPHGSLDPFLLGRHSIRKRIYAGAIGNRCWSGAAALLFNSEEERRLAFGRETARAGKNSPPSFVVPVGIETEWFDEPDSGAEERVQQMLPACGESGEREWIVFFGRLDFKKGLDLLVRSFAEVARRRPLAHLILAGPESPGYAAKVRGWLAREGVLDRATFVGPLEGRERVALVRRARMLALLSYSENFGQVVAEAMAARVPVVISDRVNICHDIESARAGIVVPCDASKAAIAIETLLEDPLVARQMGERGRLWAERHWTWVIVADEMVRAYASLAMQQETTSVLGTSTSTATRRAPVSVLIPTRNEESNIEKCLASASWADEIVIVDSASSDRTVELARAHGATVVPFVWDGTGPRKRNWALANHPWKNPWVLLLDADEEVTPDLANEIARVVRANPSEAGFLIHFHYFFLGKLLRHGDPLWKLCLVRHHDARFEAMDVPEVTSYDVELHEWVRVAGRVGRLRSVMLHRDFQNLRHHFDRHNIYSEWEALLRTRHRRRDVSGEVRPRLFGSPVERRRFFKRWFLAVPGKPWLYFFYSYLLRGGFLDGRPGFIYNALKSVYWYQVSAKEYELRLAERDAAKRERRIKAVPSPAPRTPGTRSSGEQRAAQVEFYREAVDPEEEITRPRCYPRPVQFLLDYKIRTAWALLCNGRNNQDARASAPEKESVLVVCCGSGMEAEMIARTGRRVVALDISVEAVARARERATRFGFPLETMVGDAEHLPFPDNSFDYVFVHDGLHHLPDAYRGVREMFRVARRAVVIAEPADAALTHLSVRLGLSGVYEEAGNFVYRLDPQKLAGVFRDVGAARWRMRRSLIYYQPWTFRFYRWLEPRPLAALFRAAFFACNFAIGRWGNSLRGVAWKNSAQGEVSE